MKYVITTKYLKINEKLMCMSHGLKDDSFIATLLLDDRLNVYAFVDEADYVQALKHISKNAVDIFSTI